MQYCPHCMRPTVGETCTHCGGQLRWKAPPTQLPLGTLLRGSSNRVYQLGAAKGQGGFGITYAALDLTTSTRVAVKEYYPTRCAVRDHMNGVVPATGQLEAFRSGMHSFLEEAKTLSTVGALPSVVSIRDYFESNGTAYLVMEYVEGDPLHEVVAKTGPMSEDVLMPVLKDLMRDLSILHRANVIHRDISPDNLILTPQGTLKLLDFGAARSMQDGKSMTVMLKAGFSPVEQYQSKGQGPYTDVYALAGTIYYCLTGKVPPTAIDRITEDELVPPTQLGAKLKKRREEALLWAMAVQPTARPQNMDIFTNAMFPVVPTSTQTQDAPKDRQVRFDTQTGKPLTQEGRVPRFDTNTGKPLTQEGQVPRFDTNTGKRLTGTERSPVDQGREARKSRKGLFLGLGAGAALIAVAVLVLVLLSGGTTKDGYRYRVSGGDIHITGYTGSSSVLTVPETVKDRKVVTLREGAFSGIRNVTAITIPESVTTVEAGAFSQLPKLEMVTVLGKSTRIEKGAFSGCGSLRAIFFSSKKAHDAMVSGGALRGMDNVGVCYLGQEFPSGKVQYVRVENGVPYAFTDSSQAVLLLDASDFATGELPAFVNGMRLFDTVGRRVGAVMGHTEDGFDYEIIGEEALIVGYTGSESIVGIPETVEGKTVTVVTAGAFKDNATMQYLFLTANITTIEPNAFVNCPDLRSVYVYSDMTVAAGTFVNCPRLRCVMENYCSVAGWTLPDTCKVVRGFEDTGAGNLVIVEVDDKGVIYGLTDTDDVVLMSLPAGIAEFRIPTSVMGEYVTWTHPDALEDVSPSTVIHMAPNMGFPFELMEKADWEFCDLGDFSHNWLLSCTICREINEARTGNQPRIVPDIGVVRAAEVRAREMNTSNSHTRPSGERWSTTLTEQGVDWASARAYKDSVSTADTSAFTEAYKTMILEMVDSFTGTNDSGEYFVLFGAALYVNSRNMAYCNGIAVVQ